MVKQIRWSIYTEKWWSTIAKTPPGDGIAAWDGTSWTQLGTGIATGQIWDIEVYNNELWVGGAYTGVGGLSDSYISKWDGAQWHSLGITLNNAVTSMAVLDNDLYIGGAFKTMNGDTVNNIIRYNYLTGFQTLQSKKNNFKIYPNPTSGNIVFSSFETIEEGKIQLFNVFGKKVFEENIHHSTNKEINIKHLPDGIYFVQVFDGKNQYCRKIIIEHT